MNRYKTSWKRLLVIALITVLTLKFIVQITWIQGKAMEPTVSDSSLHAIDLISYRFVDPTPGDIVAFKLAGRKVLKLGRVVDVPDQEYVVISDNLGPKKLGKVRRERIIGRLLF